MTTQQFTDSRSEFISINGLRYHIRRWGSPDAPLLLLLHGWMDMSATFQFTINHFAHTWNIVAPDWRGFGLSEHVPGGYYAPDYLADLDALLTHYSPHAPARIVGHSMGGMIACLYAGIRTDRVARLTSIEGFGLSATSPDEAPHRYARWLSQRRASVHFSPLGGLDDIAQRLMKRNPHLPTERAYFLAEALSERDADGTLRYRADPVHKQVNPVLYHLEEAKACWRHIHCPIQWIRGEESDGTQFAQGVFATLDKRRSCFAHLQETVIKQAGHMVQWDQPEALAQAIEGFMW